MAAPSPVPRRTVLPRWINTRLFVGVGLVLVSMLGGARLLAAADSRVAVVAMRADRSAGTVLTGADLSVVRVHLPSDTVAGYARTVDAVIGRRLLRSTRGGELIPLSAVVVVASSMTVVVPFGAEATPDLSAGDRVRVWSSSKGCAVHVLLDDATVQDVRTDNSGFNGAPGQSAVLSLPPDQAAAVVAALAQDGVVLRAALLVGPAPPAQVGPDPTICTGSGG
jgi:hypothetical protein